MKTSLAIVLAAAALVFSATVSLNSTAASACYSNKSPLCGAVAPQSRPGAKTLGPRPISRSDVMRGTPASPSL